jgi:DNA-binding protein WhiA
MENGSISNPQKSYHWEIVCEKEQKAIVICEIIQSFDLDAKVILRKQDYVVYLKDGEQIADILSIMGAHIARLEFENVKILKGIRNTVNRGVNCETANLNKVISTGIRQKNDIEYIDETVGIYAIPSNLQEIAMLRRDNADVSLEELGSYLNPPLGKSGVNHRLRKISKIADDLRQGKAID